MKTTILVQCSIEHHGDKCGEDDRTHCPWAERSWYGCIAWNRSLSKVGCVGRERVRCSECLAATEGKEAENV